MRLPSGKPVKLINDAAMQALGSYEGGSMLFLGLGTGLGSALIYEGVLEPLEFAHLPYKKGTHATKTISASAGWSDWAKRSGGWPWPTSWPKCWRRSKSTISSWAAETRKN